MGMPKFAATGIKIPTFNLRRLTTRETPSAKKTIFSIK
jgi:hypothetical protein